MCWLRKVYFHYKTSLSTWQKRWCLKNLAFWFPFIVRSVKKRTKKIGFSSFSFLSQVLMKKKKTKVAVVHCCCADLWYIVCSQLFVSISICYIWCNILFECYWDNLLVYPLVVYLFVESCCCNLQYSI